MRLVLLLTAAATVSRSALAQDGGSFVTAGHTLVSAMMMFVGNEEKVYILDKAESNQQQINNHPAWGAVWDIPSRTATVMDIYTNSFCASGMHVPNGSFVTFGGNGAVGPNGSTPTDNTQDVNQGFDAIIGDHSGLKSIRVLNPCLGDPSSSNFSSTPNIDCQWYDDPTVLSMQAQRWYSAAEALADGSIAIIGGFTGGGYINRNTNNSDPTGNFGADFTYEFFPANGRVATQMQFMVTSSGLNAYAHTFMMPSGKMFLQANLSTILWDAATNSEFTLPDMPNGVARVYPASGATAMLPLTPANDYTPTILFCGGTNMTWEEFGNYVAPTIDTFYNPASADCQTITPEPADGSPAAYTQDDNLPVGRTMGQFIALPDGTMLLINGAENGTAGYSPNLPATGRLVLADMPYGESLSAGPVYQPVIYDPRAQAGSRFSSAGLASSNIERLYHSTALLLPDASVLVAGSNPNIDVNLTTIYPTTYTAEIFYPPYFSAPSRPTYTGAPSVLTYGGSYFNLSVPSTGYRGDANAAAGNTTVMLMRPGFTTHAMNMGQRSMQLNNTFSVSDTDGSITLYVSQPPPNANLMQPGPAYLFVVVNGIPSNGSYVIVGSGQIETQALLQVQTLPESVRATVAVNGTAPSGSGPGSSHTDTTTSSTHLSTGALVGIIIGAVAALAVVGGLINVCIRRRRTSVPGYVPTSAGAGAAMASERTYAMDAYGVQGPSYLSGESRHNSYANTLTDRSSIPLAPIVGQAMGSPSWSTPSFDPYRDNPGHGGSASYADLSPAPSPGPGQQPFGGAGYGQVHTGSAVELHQSGGVPRSRFEY